MCKEKRENEKDGMRLGGKQEPHHSGIESHFKETEALFCGHFESVESFYARK